jgi:hypothetical protein
VFFAFSSLPLFLHTGFPSIYPLPSLIFSIIGIVSGKHRVTREEEEDESVLSCAFVSGLNVIACAGITHITKDY